MADENKKPAGERPAKNATANGNPDVDMEEASQTLIGIKEISPVVAMASEATILNWMLMVKKKKHFKKKVAA